MDFSFDQDRMKRRNRLFLQEKVFSHGKRSDLIW